MRWFLTMASVVLVVVALTVVIHDKVDSKGSSTTSTTAVGDTTVTTSAPGATAVSGTVTAVHLTGAVLDPRAVPTPLTINATRGLGNGAQLPNVRVGGAISSINWDAGRPFVLASGPGLQLDPVTADLTSGGIRLALGDTAASFLPGTYQLNTPVAVGGESTTPTERDAVTFTVQDGDGAQLQATGDANLLMPPSGGAVHLKGPGGAHLEGTLTVTTNGKKRSVHLVNLVSGPYDLVLSPTTSGGWTVAGEVQSQGPSDLQLASGTVLVGIAADLR